MLDGGNKLRHLEWDSSHFHFPIAAYRWKGELHEIEEIVRRARNERYALLYVYAPPDTKIPDSVRASCAHVFCSERIEFSKAITSAVPPHAFPEGRVLPVPWNIGDLPALHKLGVLAGTYSRFVRDQRFPRHLARELFELWAEASVSGKMAEIVFGLRLDDRQLEGFVTVLKEEQVGRIGLIAVDPGVSKKGFGRLLLAAAETWMYTSGLKEAHVTTQADNEIAKIFYRRNGYSESGRENIFHLWLTNEITADE